MSPAVLLVALFVLVAVVVAAILSRRARRRDVREAAEDAAAETAQAAQWTDRLSGRISRMRRPDVRSAAARECFHAAERCHEAAARMLREAGPAARPADALRIREAAIEGLHYGRAAAVADGTDPGAPLPGLTGADVAGAVEADHVAHVDGRALRASPAPSDAVPHYFPGGVVRGRPVPRGWYSQRWWAAALEPSGWPPEATGLFDALLSGDPGIGYDAADFESGYGAHPAG